MFTLLIASIYYHNPSLIAHQRALNGDWLVIHYFTCNTLSFIFMLYWFHIFCFGWFLFIGFDHHSLIFLSLKLRLFKQLNNLPLHFKICMLHFVYNFLILYEASISTFTTILFLKYPLTHPINCTVFKVILVVHLYLVQDILYRLLYIMWNVNPSLIKVTKATCNPLEASVYGLH